MLLLDVFTQQITTEIAIEVTPNRMDVVGIVLHVAGFHEKGGALDAVVVGVAQLEATCPAEADFINAGGFDFRHVSVCEVFAVAAGVFGNELEQGGALRPGEGGAGDADGVQHGRLPELAAEDFRRGLWAEDDFILAAGNEAADEGAGEVFFGSEDAQAGERSLADLAGIGAEKRGGERNFFPLHVGEIQGNMVAFEAPAPARGIAWGAEDGDEIAQRIADFGAFFNFGEDGFQAHDLGHFKLAFLAERRFKEHFCAITLGLGHFLEGQAGAVPRGVAEVFPLVMGKRERGLAALIRIQRIEELSGSGGDQQWLRVFGRKRQYENQSDEEVFHEEKIQSSLKLPGKWRSFEKLVPCVAWGLPLTICGVTRHRTDDLRITGLNPLISPAVLAYYLPLSEQASELVASAREQADAILRGGDDRLLAIVGPCSIHDPEAAIEYAKRLKDEAKRLEKDVFVIMRVYFEKPRTTVGWKGLINDPGLDDSFDINQGLRIARGLLLELANMGVPAGTEFLDTITPQYIADLIAWGAIGARTTESQIHRELASGLSMPVGFKNGTSGSIQIALDAIQSSSRPHHFLSVTKQGVSAIVCTAGNESCHLILRGGKTGPNYEKSDVDDAAAMLQEQNLPESVMIDCSHGNSMKDYHNQPLVAKNVAKQIAGGSRVITSVMIESNMVEGNQKLAKDLTTLTRGQSVTDACIGWDDTVEVLNDLAEAVRRRREA